MPAPERFRNARLDLPRLSLPAILGFTVAGFGGALFLVYTNFSGTEIKHATGSANDVPVYLARAVPRDPQPEDLAQRTAAIARALTVSESESPRSETSEDRWDAEKSGPLQLSEGNAELRGFSGLFANFSGANNYLAVTGTTFGISAQMAPSGFVAPDAETAISSAVPETSTWLCGAGLLGLVVARGLHASWHRNHRRGEKPAPHSRAS